MALMQYFNCDCGQSLGLYVPKRAIGQIGYDSDGDLDAAREISSLLGASFVVARNHPTFSCPASQRELSVQDMVRKGHPGA